MRPLVLLGLLCCLSGSAALSGPGAVSGHVGDSLSMTCHYGAGYKVLRKYWCRGADWGPCKILVQTNGTEQVVRRDRVTIVDDQRRHMFTVTMKQLSSGDADTYWCGIEKPGIDLGVQVKVTVGPAPATMTTTTTTTTTTTNAPTSTAVTDETTDAASVTRPPSNTMSSLLRDVHFLLLVFLKVPLLLAMVGAILWVNWPLWGPKKRLENLQSPSIEGPQSLGARQSRGAHPACPVPTSRGSVRLQLSVPRPAEGAAVVREG